MVSKIQPQSLTLYGSRGFSLIELVSVIVILAILAVLVIPKLTDLSKAARISGLNATAGAMKAAAHLAFQKCAVTPLCDISANPSGAFLSPTGVSGVVKFGYPTGYSRVPSYFGIKDWMVLSGGQKIEEESAGVTTTAYYESAPNSALCKVTYTTNFLVAPGMTPRIQVITTGC